MLTNYITAHVVLGYIKHARIFRFFLCKMNTKNIATALATYIALSKGDGNVVKLSDAVKNPSLITKDTWIGIYDNSDIELMDYFNNAGYECAGFKLMNDLKMEHPIVCNTLHETVFDGNGKSIIYSSQEWHHTFERVANSTIQNLTVIINEYVYNESPFVLLVMGDSCNIINCHLKMKNLYAMNFNGD